MNKKFWVGFIVVFLVMAVWEFVVNMFLLQGDYQATSQLWRPMEEMKFGLFYAVYLIVSFFFTLIFSKGYEGKGVQEGWRYGFYVGMIMATSMAYGTYGSMPIPYSLALKWFVFGLLQYIVLGTILAAIFGKDARVTRVKAA
jgi:hypothetical protein